MMMNLLLGVSPQLWRLLVSFQKLALLIQTAPKSLVMSMRMHRILTGEDLDMEVIDQSFGAVETIL